VSGQRIEFGAEGGTPVHVAIEPIVGPDGDAMDLGAEASVGPAGQKISITDLVHTRVSKPAEIVLEKPGVMVVTMRMKIRRETLYWGPPPLATDKTKADALREIAGALK